MRHMPSKVAVTALALTASLVGGGVYAASTQSSDEEALAPTRQPASTGIERKVDRLVARMTTMEKLQQVQLLSDGQITDADAKAGSAACSA